MFRNYLATMMRNVSRNKLYAALNIVGLAVAFTVALLIGLFVRNELTYDRWLPGHENVYKISTTQMLPGRSPVVLGLAPAGLAHLAKLNLPFVESAARVSFRWAPAPLRIGDLAVTGWVFEADPEIFSVLPLRAVAGDLATALEQPDSVVVTQSQARRLFGTEDAVGKTLEFRRQYILRVTAVIEDLPANSHLALEIIVSARASFSRLAERDAAASGSLDLEGFTYLRVRPGTPREAIVAGISSLLPVNTPQHLRLAAIPVADVHLTPAEIEMKPAGNAALVYSLAAVAGLIVLLAAINFIGLSSARAPRRAVEVGVRKVSGATRAHLMVQFIGESLCAVCFAAALSAAAAILFLPSLNAYLGRTIAVDLTREPATLAGVIGFALILSVAAGFYPAIVQSAARPGSSLKETRALSSPLSFLRQTLVIVQFAILIGLILVTTLIYRQTGYAIRESLRLNADQVLTIYTGCRDELRDRILAAPGVTAAACSLMAPFENSLRKPIERPDGASVVLHQSPVGAGFFELYGIRPVAGRFFSPDLPGDAAVPGDLSRQPPIVINETAVRQLGFSSPEAAIGKTLSFYRFAPGNRVSENLPAEIIGVVPDFLMGSVREAIGATAYFIDPSYMGQLHVKLAGRQIPETLQALDEIWRQMEGGRKLAYTFFDQRVEELYRDITRQSEVLSFLAAAAVAIACLGLFGLSSFAAEARTKEIGIRKAMGASSADILRLVLWQFAKPVVWANVLAWPVTYFIMRRWLEGFAYHVDLELWMFVAASAFAIVIAVATVIGHALLVSRARPTSALRYE